MRKQLVALTIAGTALAGIVAAPGARAADTETTFVLSAAGGLSISAPVAVELSSGTATNAGTITAQLGAVTVTDERGSLLGSWTASVTASDFTTGDATADETIPRDNVAYLSGVATNLSGVGVFTPGQVLPEALSASRNAYVATATVGNTSVTWNPTVTVTVPSDAVVGTYEGTITHSAA